MEIQGPNRVLRPGSLLLPIPPFSRANRVKPLLVLENAEKQQAIINRLESWAGIKFRGPVHFLDADLRIEDDELNPEGEMGCLGSFDYAHRNILLDLKRILPNESQTTEDVAAHEALHILERDCLDGRNPIYSHLMHTVYFGRPEQERLLKMAYAITDERVKKLLFDGDLDTEFGLVQEKLRKSIMKIEGVLKKKREDELKPRMLVSVELVAMDLASIKTVYFSLILNEPRLAIEFLKKAEDLTPWGSFISGQVLFDFRQEEKILKELTVQRKEIST